MTTERSCRTAVIACLLLAMCGCRGRPLQTILRGDMTMSGEMATVMRTDNRASRLRVVPVYAASAQNVRHAPSVAVIDVDGLLVNRNLSGFGSFGENPVALFREKLDCIACNEQISAIVLRINSPGGGVAAADMMARDLQHLKAQRNIPVVACLMDVGAGGGYYLATGADRIITHPTSVVGGIGVLLNVYNMEDGLAQFGIVSIPVKAGERIDLATPERLMEREERDILQGIADQFHDRFIRRVREARSQVRDDAIFDGRVVTGEQAVVLGLADQLGYLDDAIVQARQLAGLPAESSIVMLRRESDRAYTPLDVTPNTPTTSSIIPLRLPGLDRSALPTFLYMWQADPSLVTTSGG
jgi:protease IV